jgi:endonuclease/exonuclease/phosphatase family metal-dependent hydrolase
MMEEGSSGSVAVPERSQEHGTNNRRWGDNLNKKQSSTIRIGFNNINGFKSEINNVNNHDIRSFISKYEFDIFGMSEVNLHWKNCCHHWTECTRGWFHRLHTSVAYFKAFPTRASFQVGGVMQFIMGSTTSRVSKAGKDVLGRWAWHTLRGKNNRQLRVISAYRPVRNESNAGSVWNQQQFYADLMNIKLNPHESWIADVSSEIRCWMAAGDSIIMMVDLNDDVMSSQVANTLRRLGLHEIVSKTHGNITNTHQRGSRPIDGIFVSGEICATACGYIESPSDHLALWLDVELDTLFGDFQKDSGQQIRRLQCSDPRTVKKYNQVLWDKVEQQGLMVQVERLTSNQLNHKAKANQWEKIDKAMVKFRLMAEKKCRKIKVGRVQWTPELARLRLIKKFWVLAYRRSSKYAIDFKFFSRIARKLNKDPKTNWQIGDIYDNIKQAKEDLKAYKRKHINKRSSWLDNLALAMAQEDGRDDQDIDLRATKYITILKHREAQRTSARVIRRITRGTKACQQLDHVVVDVEGSSKSTTTKDEMECALLAENQQRFNQARDCPFLVEPLAGIVGRYADNDALSILTNQVQDHRTGNMFTDMVLQALQGPANRSTIQLDLSTESYEQGWLKCKEQTASGPSGIHFGHFIAACRHSKLKTLECAMANFPMKTGYSPVRWQRGVEVMLLKQFNNFHVNKLRAILLFEADFNFNNKRIGRSLMWKAEDEQWLAPEQYGSRKHYSAIDHCLNKRLSFDILRQYKQSGAICVNDMKGCYDRIVHSVASLCMQRWGMPIQPIRMMLRPSRRLCFILCC